MKILQKICFVLLLATFLSVSAGSCFDNVTDVNDCRGIAEQGHPGAQFNLALKYEDGQGVPQDYKEAVKWYTKELLSNVVYDLLKRQPVFDRQFV